MSAAYLDAFARFADVDGRTSRRAFWGFWLVHAALTLALGAASAVAGTLADLPWVAGSAVLALYLVLAFFPSLALIARRLHDTGRTSWLCALIGLPPLTLLVVYWCLLPGEPGPNDWGQPPR